MRPRRLTNRGGRPHLGARRRAQDHGAGAAKPDIEDKVFASAVFGIWLGDKPIQNDIKADLGKMF